MKFMKTTAVAAALAVSSLSLAFAQDDASSALQSLLDDHWAWSLEQSPVFATTLGVRDYDDRISSPSLETNDAQVAKMREFKERLEAIDRDALEAQEKINRDLLLLNLSNSIEADEYGGKYMLMTNRYGPHTTITRMPDRLPFFTKADYESYVTRLGDIPRYLSEATDTLRAGAEAGWTQPCEPMKRVDGSIRFHLIDDVSDSVFMKPFETKPATMKARDWKNLEKRARKAVKESVLPAMSDYADFYSEEYSKSCREEIGASTLPDGADYYAYRARVFTTTDRTPDDIHELGLSEVKRIRGEMDDVIKEVDFKGDFKAFQEFLRTDPQFYAESEERLVEITAALSKRIDGEMPKLFTRLPRMPYTVKPVPEDIAEGATTAYYERPAGDGSRAGVYRINTSLLDQRPLFELEALSLHEAVPGHHFQIALSRS